MPGIRGNRWPDVCALCDRAIDMTKPWTLHRYLGPGWVHGGGRESIPVHHVCAYIGRADLDGLHPSWFESWRYLTLPADERSRVVAP